MPYFNGLRTLLSFRTQSYVILNEVKNLIDPSLTLRMTKRKRTG